MTAGLFCPYCGVATAFTPVFTRTQGLVLEPFDDDTTRRQDVAVRAVVERDDRAPHYAIIDCPSCHRLFVAVKEYGTYGDWQTVWPLRTRQVSEHVPEPVRLGFEEALLCLAAKAVGGCLLMCRTTLIRLQRDKNAANLAELRDKGLISTMLYEQANEVRLWANVVGHEDFDPGALTTDLCEELVDYVESLLDSAYVQPARLAEHRRKRGEAEGKA